MGRPDGMPHVGRPTLADWSEQLTRETTAWLDARQDARSDAVLAVLRPYTEQRVADRVAIKKGELEGPAARARALALTERVDLRMVRLLGEHDAAALRRHLEETVVGGGW